MGARGRAEPLRGGAVRLPGAVGGASTPAVDRGAAATAAAGGGVVVAPGR